MFFETVKIVCFEFVQPQYTTWHIGHLLAFELNGYLCEYWSSTHMCVNWYKVVREVIGLCDSVLAKQVYKVAG